jgi:hypothetical protein
VPQFICGQCRTHFWTDPMFRPRYCQPCKEQRDECVAMFKGDARLAVTRAIRRGEIADPNTLVCMDCGKQAAEYDHRNYHKPLDVQPVCKSCNRKRGPGYCIGFRHLSRMEEEAA